MRTQLCVWAGNLEFMSPWQQNPWSCIMDYHWNSTPLPNIMRARDLIKSAHSVWHKVKKELSLCWGRGWEKAGGRAGKRVAVWGCDGPGSCRASSLIDGSRIHQWTYRQMVLNAWNFQPRKQLLSLTSAVRITLLSWNIGQGEENVDGDAAQSAGAHAGLQGPGQSVQNLHLVALSHHHHLPCYFSWGVGCQNNSASQELFRKSPLFCVRLWGWRNCCKSLRKMNAIFVFVNLLILCLLSCCRKQSIAPVYFSDCRYTFLLASRHAEKTNVHPTPLALYKHF